MPYRLEFRPYTRQFQPPLHTSHGVWSDRQGIILQLTSDSGQIGWGEIAPIEWFGSESFEQALDFCCQYPTEINLETIFSIPVNRPACRFGFESAWESLNDSLRKGAVNSPLCSRLLPAGCAALQAWQTFWQQGDRTFKWKIGVASPSEELAWLAQLLQELPADAKLRLDANGGLTWDTACQWLDVCSGYPQVEFLEQPLPVGQFDDMLKLSRLYPTPLALDESVATLEQLKACYDNGWRGIFVVKAAIAGSPKQIREFCQKENIDVVWSSVFETAIAQHFIQNRLIPSVPQQHRAIGFGVNSWFSDTLNQLDCKSLWQTLSPISHSASVKTG